jgi:hypothetical protein
MTNRKTIYCKLLAKKEGTYTQYVFENLDQQYSSFDRYIMCTKCPNWQNSQNLNVGIVGYLLFEPVEAGEKYYNYNDEQLHVYKHSAFYFINFIESDLNQISNTEFNF